MLNHQSSVGAHVGCNTTACLLEIILRWRRNRVNVLRLMWQATGRDTVGVPMTREQVRAANQPIQIFCSSSDVRHRVSVSRRTGCWDVNRPHRSEMGMILKRTSSTASQRDRPACFPTGTQQKTLIIRSQNHALFSEQSRCRVSLYANSRNTVGCMGRPALTPSLMSANLDFKTCCACVKFGNFFCMRSISRLTASCHSPEMHRT